AKLRDCRYFGAHLDSRKVRISGCSHERGWRLGPIGKDDLQALLVGYYVLIGYDIALIVNNHARTQGLRSLPTKAEAATARSLLLHRIDDCHYSRAGLPGSIPRVCCATLLLCGRCLLCHG